MTFLHKAAKAIFIGDPQWSWRRRIAISGAATMLTGVLHSIYWDHDIAHASMVMTNCIAGFGGIMTIYVGGVVTDDHLKRSAESRSSPPILAHEE